MSAGIDSMFRHGVASGDPHTTDVLIWTRVTVPSRRPITVRWHLEQGGAAALSGYVEATSQQDHTVTVRVAGLRPGLDATYWFEVGAERSPEGTTRTLPDTPRPFRIGVVCCAHYQSGSFDAYRLLADERPDLVVHLGDYIYEDGPHVTARRRVSPPHLARTLTDYRRRHAQTRTDPDLQHLHAVAPFVAVWDDHDVADNTPLRSSRHAARRRAAGMRAWGEWLPIDACDRAIDREIRLPGIADMYVLDTRFEGRRPADSGGPEVTPDPQDAPRPLLSQDQWARFERSYGEERAPHGIVFSQVQVGPMVLAWRPAWPPWRRPWFRPIVNPDQWDGHPEERRRLYDTIRRRTTDTLVVSGDLHSSWHRTLYDDGRPLCCEATVPSVAGNTYARSVRLRTGLPPQFVERVLRRLNRGVHHLDTRHHGYTVIDLVADGPTVTSVLLHRGGMVERVPFI